MSCQTVDERWAERLEQAYAMQQGGAAVAREPHKLEVVGSNPTPAPNLTDRPALSLRELDVLLLIADGKTYGEIATILGLTIKTVDSYLVHIRQKLNCHGIAGLVRYAVRTGLIDA